MAYSLSSQIKLTREQLANIALDYNRKFQSDLAISRDINVKVVERLVAAERKRWTSEQYPRRECLKISGISDSFSDNARSNYVE